MAEHILIIVFAFTLAILLVRYLKVKHQIKNIQKQLQGNERYRHTVFVELFDHDIDSLALAINHLIEENNQMLTEAEKSNQFLKNAIADISHDMRTPLTSVIGYMQLLRHSGLDDKQLEKLNIALDKSQYLRQLLSEFFELSALNVSNDIPELKKVDLASVVSETILDNAPGFDDKDITPIFVAADIPVFILGDVGMLQRITQNIVSNCLKYSSGNVVFNINEKKDVLLSIENPVADIEQIDTERIFERFYKGNVSRNEKGTGLGLSIAYLLVKKMGGSISAYVKNDLFIIQLIFPKISE